MDLYSVGGAAGVPGKVMFSDSSMITPPTSVWSRT